MEYRKITEGRFLDRPNRFIARVEICGKIHTVHVKNTGRCKELLIPGTRVWLEKTDNPCRKTEYDLVSLVKKQTDGMERMVNLDSQAPNAVAEEYVHHCPFFSPSAKVRREVTYRNSRFDLYVEDGPRKCFMEVKGVTLERDGIALFPDAPTERGVKHLNELMVAHQEGYEACIFFVIQMKGIRHFTPNDETHAEFGRTLREAAGSGVHVLAVDCIVTPGTIRADALVPVQL